MAALARPHEIPVTPQKRGSCDASIKRLSQGRFPWWPSAADGGAQRLAAHQLAVLLSAGDPTRTGAAADWRPVGPWT
jgi:hypothetical protein